MHLFWRGCSPKCHSLKSHGPVHEVKVQVGQTQVGQTGPAGVLHIFWIVLGVPQFGSHKKLITPQCLVCKGHVSEFFALN